MPSAVWPSLSFFVNGRAVEVRVDPTTPLVDVLRDGLGLTGTKIGCDHEGECGACTVLLDGRAVRSCLTPVGKVVGRRMQTVEGLATDHLHPLQQAFIDVGAVQCGYCTPGILMATKGLLDRELHPSREQIIEALEGNLCRCTGYQRILLAVNQAAACLRGDTEYGAPGRASACGAPISAGTDAGDSPCESGRRTQIEGSVPGPQGRVVGGDHRRADAVDKVTGRAPFVEDIVLPGMLYAKVLRCPHPHARLLSLDPDRALRVPGVERILTAEDIPGDNALGEYSQDEPVLTPLGATAKMVGAPIALVVAASAELAQAGVEAIAVKYEVLPHTYDMDEALGRGRYQDCPPVSIYEGGNLLTTAEVRHGNLDEILAGSDVIVETEYRTAYLEHSALEREATLGYIDSDGRLTVVGPTHEPHWNRGYIAAVLGIDPEAVRFVTPPIGGSFGGKQDPWPCIAVALAVFHLRRPVRLAYTRQESFDASPKRHPYQVKYRIGAARDGRLTGVHVRITANTGGYDAHGQYLPEYAVVGSGGAYRWQAVDAYAQTVFTNGPKSGQFRGFGNPQATFALECTLDEMAERLEIDPLEFRLKNALRQSDISFLGYPVAESMGYAEVLRAIRPRYQELLRQAADYNAAALLSKQPKRKGIGLAGMWYRFGKSGSLRVEAQAELASNGRFVIYCSAPDYGQGTNTVLSQLAAEALGVSRDRLDLVNADTALTPDSGIQGASRSTYFVGGAVYQAATILRHTVQTVACELLDCHPSEVAIQDGRALCVCAPEREVSLAEVAGEFDRIGLPTKVAGAFDLSSHFPEQTRPLYVPLFCTAAHVAEVEVDLRTGVVQVLRAVAAHDVGRVVNPVDAQGQVEGAVVMGLGAALMEELLPGATAGFTDYYLPTFRSMPEMEVLLVEVPSFHGPLGVKGLGEAAMPPSTPAILNAVCRAIGRRIREIPATPERVLGALQGSLPGLPVVAPLAGSHSGPAEGQPRQGRPVTDHRGKRAPR